MVLFVFYIYFAGVGAREIITMDCNNTSAEQDTTAPSGLHDSLKREPSTRDLASLDSFAGQSTRRKLARKSSQKVARLFPVSFCPSLPHSALCAFTP